MISLPILLVSFVFTSELVDLTMYQTTAYLSEFGFWMTMTGVLVCGCFLCFSQFWCTTNNNALTTSVIGVLKSFIQTVFGMFLFDARKEIGLFGYVGIIINLIFGVMYTYLKYIEKEAYIRKTESENEIHG